MTGAGGAAGGWLPVDLPEAPSSVRLRPSLRAAFSIFVKLVAFILFLVGLPVLVAVLAGHGAALLGSILLAQFGFAAALPAIAGMVLPALRLMATTYELDEEGVRVRSSIIARSDQRVPWDKVTLLVQRRSLVDRALGIETLSIVAYGVRGATVNLVGLRDAAPVRLFAAKRMRESASVASLFSND